VVTLPFIEIKKPFISDHFYIFSTFVIALGRPSRSLKARDLYMHVDGMHCDKL
jgi:hypothetical protein